MIKKRNYITWHDKVLNRLFGTRVPLSVGVAVVFLLVPSWLTNGSAIELDTDVEVRLPIRWSTHGIDISHHNGKVDWDVLGNYTAHATAPKFCFLKTSEGASFVDKNYNENLIGAREQGIVVGAYHFYNPTVDPRHQALNFILNAKLSKGDLSPVIDFEKDSRNARVLLRNITLWIDIVEKHYGVKPIIYTNKNLYKKYIRDNFEGYPVWISHYDTTALEQIKDTDVKFWQYSMTGQIEGVPTPVDLNVFFGNEIDFKKLLIK